MAISFQQEIHQRRTAKQWQVLIQQQLQSGQSVEQFYWLLSNTERGAGASAVIYSMIETAKANGENTDAYLKMLLEELPKRQQGQAIGDLVPWVFKG